MASNLPQVAGSLRLRSKLRRGLLNRDRGYRQPYLAARSPLLGFMCEDLATLVSPKACRTCVTRNRQASKQAALWDECVQRRRGAGKEAVTRARSSRHPWGLPGVSRLDLCETQYTYLGGCKLSSHSTEIAVLPCRVLRSIGVLSTLLRRDSSPVEPHRPGIPVGGTTTQPSNHICQTRPGIWDNRPVPVCTKTCARISVCKNIQWS